MMFGDHLDKLALMFLVLVQGKTVKHGIKVVINCQLNSQKDGMRFVLCSRYRKSANQNREFKRVKEDD